MGTRHGVALDLGVSSMQIDYRTRGFSFLRDGPLDMRMEKSGRSAADVVNTLSEKELSDIIFTYGEERHARRVARAIVEARKAKRAMEALAKASGGAAVFPETVEAVDSVALAIAQEIRSQYIITYSPVNQNFDGGFRQVNVTAAGPNRPVVRTRSGYYANADPTKRDAPAKASTSTPPSTFRR